MLESNISLWSTELYRGKTLRNDTLPALSDISLVHKYQSSKMKPLTPNLSLEIIFISPLVVNLYYQKD